jgi:hypothetical protein
MSEVNVGLAIMTPAAVVSTGGATAPPCYGALTGGHILQVLNLVTGADVTASFDPYLPGPDNIVQLDTTPSSTTPHLVVFRLPGLASVVGVKFAVVQALGYPQTSHSVPLVPTAIAAAGVKAGDAIVSAFSAVTNFSLNVAGNVAGSFAPTSPSDGTVTQIFEINVNDSTLLFLQNSGAATPSVGISVMNGGGFGVGTIPGVLAGARPLYALDMTNVANVISSFMPRAPGDAHFVETFLSGTGLGMILLMYQNPD